MSDLSESLREYARVLKSGSAICVDNYVDIMERAASQIDGTTPPDRPDPDQRWAALIKRIVSERVKLRELDGEYITAEARAGEINEAARDLVAMQLFLAEILSGGIS